MYLTAFCVFFVSYFVAICHGQNGGFCLPEQKEPWSYRGRNGPHFWFLRYPDCAGNQQSPIALSSKDAVQDANLEKLTLNNYDQPITGGKIENNGHTIEVVPEDGNSRTISVNGEEYSLRQFHFHWGSSPNRGSEHYLDGTQYAMEMHLVHMNANNDIAVVGIFFEEGDADNEELQNLVDEFPNVRYKDQETPIQSSINLSNLLPANPTSYYRYQGSLTTPACSEGVTWSVVPDPIPVGKNQMQQFRQLYAVKESDACIRTINVCRRSCRLVNNYRPLQELNGRTVSLSK